MIRPMSVLLVVAALLSSASATAQGTLERIRERGNEFGAVTGRPRRCGWFDAPLMRYSAAINGIHVASDRHASGSRLSLLRHVDRTHSKGTNLLSLYRRRRAHCVWKSRNPFPRI